MPDTYGYPGPEGKAFWRFLALVMLTIFILFVSSPLWTPALPN